jgi:peptidoglycan/LPS O-acetylase OafA/YrhL
MNFKFRPEINGLRALAVISVFLFHIESPYFLGGFLGVDIFFLISGYLITKIIHNSLHNNTFSIYAFYERRIRRIFPALFGMLFALGITFGLLYDSDSFADFGKTLTSVALFSSNILFFKQRLGYFDLSAFSKPLLHTWSLAVEEHFYLIYPFILILINKYLKANYLKWLTILLIISLLLYVFTFYKYSAFAFYMIPARAWEFLVGALVVFLEKNEFVKIRELKYINGLFNLGIVSIISSIILYNNSFIITILFTILAVFGSFLILLFGGITTSRFSIILNNKIALFIGKISYSFYLLHWPLYCIIRYFHWHKLEFIEFVFFLLLIVYLSYLSWKYIEEPFRRMAFNIIKRDTIISSSAILILIISAIGLFIYINKGIPDRFNSNQYIVRIKQDTLWDAIAANQKHFYSKISENLPIVIGDKKTKPSFILWGDSHAMAIANGLNIIGNNKKVSGYVASSSAVPPMIGINSVTNNQVSSFNNNVIMFIKSHPEIKTVILSARWSVYFTLIADNWLNNENRYFPILKAEISKKGKIDDDFNFMELALRNTIDLLNKMNKKIIVISNVPELRNDIRVISANLRMKGLSYRNIFIYDDLANSYSETLEDYKKANFKADYLFKELDFKDNIDIIHVETAFEKNGKFILFENGNYLYRDSHHLSKFGSQRFANVYIKTFNFY